MGCLVGRNRGAKCPFPLPTMVSWQGRCPTTGLLTGPPEATCAMHKNWPTTLGHILRMRNCGSARYLFYSARYMFSNARNATIARAMLFSSAGTLEIAIYNHK